VQSRAFLAFFFHQVPAVSVPVALVVARKVGYELIVRLDLDSVEVSHFSVCVGAFFWIEKGSCGGSDDDALDGRSIASSSL
jgi:hypothetical protein